MNSPRVVSLISSGTEILYALGHIDLLVGRSHECDYPAMVQSLPLCTTPRFKVEGTSLEIDQRVKKSLLEDGAVYDIFVDKMEELQPGIILTQTQCDICAVSKKDVDQAACTSISSKPKVVALETNYLDELWHDIQIVADAINRPDDGRALITSFKKRIESIKSKSDLLTNKPTVTVIDWIEPLMAAGNWVPELVELGGGREVIAKAGEHTHQSPIDILFEKNPEYILVALCGWGIKKASEELKYLQNDSRWNGLQAVQNKNVYICDGNHFFNRPGPRLIETLEIIAEILHPEIFDFNHLDKNYIKLNSK